jgi:predicted secreted Zn-dependent protease
VLAAATLTATAGCEAATIGVLPPAPHPDGLEVVVGERTYLVGGRSVEAIGRSFDHDSPLWHRRSVQGLATWRVRWGWRSTMHGGTCRLVDARVAVRVEILLPRWEHRAGAPLALAVQWDDFEAALRRHENQHGQIGIAAGVAVLDALRALSTSDCVEMAEVAGARAREVLRRYERRNRLLDASTRQGRAQGAVWPYGGVP